MRDTNLVVREETNQRPADESETKMSADLTQSDPVQNGRKLTVGPRLGVCVLPARDAQVVHAYAHYLAKLLGGAINHIPAAEDNHPGCLNGVAPGCDLVVLGESDDSPTGFPSAGHNGGGGAGWATISFLLARRPRWPLRRILLITRVETSDETAANWAGCLAQASGASVTIQAIVPPQPALEAFLAPDTYSGEQLRQVACWLSRWGVEGRLHLRQDEPSRQIYQEVHQGRYDLLVISADDGAAMRRRLGELVSPLLRWIDRPVLVVRPEEPVREK